MMLLMLMRIQNQVVVANVHEFPNLGQHFLLGAHQIGVEFWHVQEVIAVPVKVEYYEPAPPALTRMVEL